MQNQQPKKRRFSTLPKLSELMALNKKMMVYQYYSDGAFQIMLYWNKNVLYARNANAKICEEKILNGLKDLRIKRPENMN